MRFISEVSIKFRTPGRGPWRAPSPLLGIALLVSVSCHALVVMGLWAVSLLRESATNDDRPILKMSALIVEPPAKSTERREPPLLPMAVPNLSSKLLSVNAQHASLPSRADSPETAAPRSSTPSLVLAKSEQAISTLDRESPGDGGRTGDRSELATAKLYGIESRAQSVVYVIDRSASMGLSRALPMAKRALVSSLDGLSPQVRFQVIVYNRRSEPLNLSAESGLVPATFANTQSAKALTMSLAAEGSTDHQAALKRALALRPEIIYFLTDAGDLQESEVLEVCRANRGKTVIHVILFQSSRHSPESVAIRQLSEKNGGLCRMEMILP